MKEIQKKHNKLFTSFLFTILAFIALIILLFLLPWSTDVKMSLALVLLIALLILMFWFKPRLYYYTLQIQFAKLTENPHLPIATKHDLSSRSWLLYLTKKTFKVFYENDDHVLLHRYSYDSTDFATKRPMLEIIVWIKNSDMDYDHRSLSKSINALEDDYQKNKIKYTNYSIFQIKFGPLMSEEIKEKANQISFEKQSGRRITVINCFYQTDLKTVYFLHNKTFSPSLYYTYAVDLIKTLI